MPRKTKDQRHREVHEIALQQFEDSWNATRDSRERARKARRFVNVPGAQWDWDEAGDFVNKIKFEIDQVSMALTRIKNEYRRNRISARFMPADGADADALSDACASRFRADTWDEVGRAARKNAYDSGVEGGFGGVRLRAEYETGEQQRVCLEPIFDAEATLFFDVASTREDKSDADHAFLVKPWKRDAFKAKYGEECASWPEHLRGRFSYPWFGSSADFVFVAEYFVRERETITWRIFKGFGDQEERFREDEVTPEDEADLVAQGYSEAEPEEEKVNRVVKYVMNGAKILSGPEVIAGREIPLVPMYGHRTVIDHVEHFRGHVQKLIDGQIVYNIQISKVGETATQSSVRKPIFMADQVLPHQNMWRNDAKENYPYLLIDPIYDQSGNIVLTGPVSYLEPPEVPQAVAALITLTKQDLSDQLGNPENAEQVDPGMSGIALELVQGRIDMQSYGYMDNAAAMERRIAEVWQSMAADIYVEDGRKLKTLTADGQRGTVEIGRKVMDKDGRIAAEIDFGRAAFDVEVDVGPTSASRRAAIVRTVADLIQAGAGGVDPTTQMVLTHTALMNLEGEGLQEIRQFSRKRLVGLGVVKPTKDEEAEMAAAQGQQQPDPNAVLADAMAEEARAKAMKAQADTAKSVAQTQQAQAETAATLAGIDNDARESAVRTAKAMTEGIANG